jgi:hypothetical protein
MQQIIHLVSQIPHFFLLVQVIQELFGIDGGGLASFGFGYVLPVKLDFGMELVFVLLLEHHGKVGEQGAIQLTFVLDSLVINE